MNTTTTIPSLLTRNQVNKLYCTSDGLAFLDEQEAISHAEELTDKAITSMTGEQADAEILKINEGDWLQEMEGLLIGLEQDVI